MFGEHVHVWGFQCQQLESDLGAEPCVSGVSDWSRRGCASEGEF